MFCFFGRGGLLEWVMLMLVRGSDCLRLGVFAGEWGFRCSCGIFGGIVEDYWVEWVFLAGSRGGEVSLVVCGSRNVGELVRDEIATLLIMKI